MEILLYLGDPCLSFHCRLKKLSLYTSMYQFKYFFNEHSTMQFLTLWRLSGFGNFRKKNSSFRLPYQRSSSSADCARELFNGSNGSTSLVDCTQKNFFCLGMRVFCEWRHKWRTFRPPWPTLPGPGPKPLDGSTLLKFLFKTGYNLSLLILQMTCWGFGLKSYDQKQ